jgi:hypothetical protein
VMDHPHPACLAVASAEAGPLPEGEGRRLRLFGRNLELAQKISWKDSAGQHSAAQVLCKMEDRLRWRGRRGPLRQVLNIHLHSEC